MSPKTLRTNKWIPKSTQLHLKAMCLVQGWIQGIVDQKSVENTLPMSPYKIFLNDSNGHGCYFKKYEYSNMWIIHVQSSTNLPKCMWKLVFNVADVIFWFGSFKRKTLKVQRNNAKTFKNICFWDKNCNSHELMKIWSNFNHSKVLNY